MAKRKAAKAARIEVKPGDAVLISFGVASMPEDWQIARVLWADGEDVLLDRHSRSVGEDFRQVLTIDHVRAVGDVSFLIDFKERCRKAVKELSDRVHDCETALGAARAAVWAKLDEIAAAPEIRKEKEPA